MNQNPQYNYYKNFSLNENSNIFWNFSLDKGRLKTFVTWFLKHYGEKKTIYLLEQLKGLGFEYATKAGISLGIEDLKIPPQKNELIRYAEKNLAKGIIGYRKGECTGIEKMQQFIETWHETSENLKQEVVRYFEKTDVLNPVYMMAFSGARGNLSQVRQLVGMRGLMSDPQGKIIDFPIQSNFREGLTLTEYLISTYGARKGIVDTALRTATAGYLTRRLVDVAQHVIVSKFDCGTERGIFLFDMKEGHKTIYSFQNRLTGRVLARDIEFSDFSINHSNLESPIKIGFRNQEITPELAKAISKVTKKALVRSPLTCEARKFVCQLCYGWSLSTSRLVSIGEAVGVIAGQSIGEPGTQLTMRTFHTGGVFSGGITEQIHAPFDGVVQYSEPIAGSCVRTSQGNIAFLTKFNGTLFLKSGQNKKSLNINLQNNSDDNYSSLTNAYKIPPFTLLFARHGQFIKQKNLLAQISAFTNLKKSMQTIEQTIYSNLEGEIYYSQLDLLDDIDEKSGERMLKTENWSKVWVLSGKIFKDSFNASFFPKKRDFVSKTSIMNQIEWHKDFSEFSKFEYVRNNSKKNFNFESTSIIQKNQTLANLYYPTAFQRNQDNLNFITSKNFQSFSESLSILKNKEILYINSKRSIREKFLTNQISPFYNFKKDLKTQKINLKKYPVSFFYPFQPYLRKIFLNLLSKTIVSLPILNPGALKWLTKKRKPQPKKYKSLVNFQSFDNKNQKSLIRKLNMNKKFQIYNPKKTNFFHPLILSKYVPMFLKSNFLKYHLKRKPNLFPLLTKSSIFFTNFEEFKMAKNKFQIVEQKEDLNLHLTYKDKILYKKLLLNNKTNKQTLSKILSNLKSFKTNNKKFFKNSIQEPAKQLLIKNPLIFLNTKQNRYKKFGYLTSVRINSTDKDEFFSFFSLENDFDKSLKGYSKTNFNTNFKIFDNIKQNLNFNPTKTRNKNIGLKSTYFWDFPSTSGFYWYPKFSQTLTNGIFIFSTPVLLQERLKQKISYLKTKNFKSALAYTRKYSSLMNLAQSQRKKKKNIALANFDLNFDNNKKTVPVNSQPCFLNHFYKYEINNLNFSLKLNLLSMEEKAFNLEINKSHLLDFKKTYFVKWKKSYLNMDVRQNKNFLNSSSINIEKNSKSKAKNFNTLIFESKYLYFKNSNSKFCWSIIKNFTNFTLAENTFDSKTTKTFSKISKDFGMKFDFSKKFSVSGNEIYWLSEENYLMKTLINKNQLENLKKNKVKFIRKSNSDCINPMKSIFQLSNSQGFKKPFQFSEEGLFKIKILNPSLSLKTVKPKKGKKLEKKPLKTSKKSNDFKKRFLIYLNSLKEKNPKSIKNSNIKQNSTSSLKIKLLNYIKRKNISTNLFFDKQNSKRMFNQKKLSRDNLTISILKRKKYKVFLSFMPFLKPENFKTKNCTKKLTNVALNKKKLKQNLKFACKNLNISIKPGWIYKTENYSNMFNLNKIWVNPGMSLLDDICFEHQKIFLEVISISPKTKEKSFDSTEINKLLPNGFNPSVFVKNKNCRFNKHVKIDKNLEKTKNPKIEISILIRPLTYKILPNFYQLKKNLNLNMQKTKNYSFNISYFLFQQYFFEILNPQKSRLQLISQFAPFDFNLSWSNSLNLPFWVKKQSYIEKIKSRKKKFKQKNSEIFPLLNSIPNFWSLKKNKVLIQSKNLLKKSNYYLYYRVQNCFWNKSKENIYFSQYSLNFLPVKISVKNSDMNFYSFPKIFLNSLALEKKPYLQDFSKSNFINDEIKIRYLNLLILRNCQKLLKKANLVETADNLKSFINLPNFDNLQTNILSNSLNSQPFKNVLLEKNKSGLQLKKIIGFKSFSGVCNSIPIFEFSFVQKYSYLANQRLFSSYFYQQQMHNFLKLSLLDIETNLNESLNVKKFRKTNSLNLSLSESYSDIPIVKNHLIFNKSFFRPKKKLGLTSFYSPFEGEVLKIYSVDEDANLLKNGFNTFLEPGFAEERQNQKLILTKTDLFSLKFLKEKNQTSFQKCKSFEIEKQFDKTQNLQNSKDFFESKRIENYFQTIANVHQEFQELENDFLNTFKKKNYGIFDVSAIYQNKLYKIKQVNFSLFTDLKKIRLGQFLKPGDLLNGNSTLTKCGQIIHYNAEQLTLRKAEFFSLSPQTILHKYNGHFLTKNSPVMTLPFQTLKTGDIVQGIPKVEQYLEARTTLQGRLFLNSLPVLLHAIYLRYSSHLEMEKAVRQSFLKIQQILVDGVQRVYRSQGVSIADKHLEIIVRQMTSKVQIIHGGQTGFFPGELVELEFVERINQFLMVKIRYEPVVLGITRASLEVDSFLSAASFQQTTKILTRSALENKKDFLKGLKENLLVGNLLPAGTGYVQPILYQ